jgi:hypothetical protein
MHSLLESHILLARFLNLYRVYWHIQIPQSIAQFMLSDQLIQEVIGPGLINPSYTHYINALVQLIFHILPLRLLILVWPNSNSTFGKLPLLLAAMSLH